MPCPIQNCVCLGSVRRRGEYRSQTQADPREERVHRLGQFVKMTSPALLRISHGGDKAFRLLHFARAMEDKKSVHVRFSQHYLRSLRHGAIVFFHSLLCAVLLLSENFDPSLAMMEFHVFL